MRFFLALLFILPSCSFIQSSGCVIQDKAAATASQAVVNVLQCANADVVQKDLTAVIAKVGLCKQILNTGAIANAFCPMVTAAVVKFIADQAVPSAWGCSAINAKDTLEAVLAGACSQIPVSTGK